MTRFLSLVAVTILVGSANADLIDFEALERQDAEFQTIGNTYVEDGFILTEGNGGELGNVGVLEPRFSGSTAAVGSQANSLYILSRQSGGSFGVESIDLAEFTVSESSVATVNFSGLLTGGGVVSQSFSLDGTAFAPETFSFTSDFQSIVGLIWTQSSPQHQFDNINVNVSVIPEPAAGAVLGVSLLVGMRRRR